MRFSLVSIVACCYTAFADPYLGQTLSLCDTPYMVSEKLNDLKNIYKATDAQSQEQVVLKIVDSQEQPKIQSEVEVLQALRGQKYTVQLICHENWEPYVFLVMEFCNEGTLQSKMNKNALSREYAQLWNDMAKGLLQLREKGMLHRNIKPSKLFLHDGHLKIGGFELAMRAENAAETAGTPAYMAPEVLEGGLFNPFSDLWSAGVVFYEWNNMQHPYRIFRGKNAFGNVADLQRYYRNF